MHEEEKMRPHLNTDEQLQWVGQPHRQRQYTDQGVMTFLFGLVFLGFSIFWMIMTCVTAI